MKMEWYKQRRLHTELATIVDGNVQMLKRQNKKVRNITTLPLEDCTASENTKKFAEFLEFETSEGFGEGIGYHFVCRAVRQRDMILRNGLMDEMKMNVNVFSAAVESRVLGEAYSTLVVTMKGGR